MLFKIIHWLCLSTYQSSNTDRMATPNIRWRKLYGLHSQTHSEYSCKINGINQRYRQIIGTFVVNELLSKISVVCPCRAVMPNLVCPAHLVMGITFYNKVGLFLSLSVKKFFKQAFFYSIRISFKVM